MHRSDIFTGQLNPTFLFAIKYDRTQNGYSHAHDYIELLYIYSGEGKYELDHEIYSVNVGDLLIINPGIKHANIVTNKDNPLTILALGFTDIHLKGQNENQLSFPGHPPVLSTDESLKKHFVDLFFRMLAEKEQSTPGKYDMMRCYLEQIILHIIRSFTPAKTPPNSMTFASRKKNYIIQTILDYMQEHYNEKISLDGIASNMYLSPIYISKIFKEETGEAPIHYLIHIRLQKAIEIMNKHPEYTIKDIAHMVGYEDAFYFSKIFKKYFGKTPKQFREQMNR